MADLTPPSKPKTELSAMGIPASAAGIAVGVYGGIHLLIPALGGWGVWLLGTKLFKPRDAAYLPALSIQAGHVLWMCFGALLTGSWAVASDVVVLALGVIWLWFRPSLWPVVALALYQLASIGVNAHLLMQQSIGSLPHKALVVHIALRVFALVYLWMGYRKPRALTSA